MTEANKISPFSILFVDDEENARKYFAKALKNDFNILTASSVAEAQNILNEKSREIAVTITDQRMPGGNGVILLKFLRENHPQIIRLLTTAYSDLSDAIEAVNGGEILRYIQKPWDFTMLKAEMRQALELFELRLERSQIIHEKIMVKKRIAKVERVKALILLAQYFSFLNFSKESISNFIREFCDAEVAEDSQQDWQSFDFGSYDVLETEFLAKIINAVQQEIPFGDYKIGENIDSNQITKIAERLNRDLNVNTEIKISGAINQQTNIGIFTILLKQLINIASSNNSSILISEKEQKTFLNLNFKISSDLAKNNILITAPNQDPNRFYTNLITCYLLAIHHGGTININNNGDDFNLEILLPKNQSDSPLFSKINLDDLILSAMSF